ncbi:PREDICTED: GDSL esterase/lipase At2g40250-like [Tarenaya hassleriana]|uniref:GDSL esterase/lipase At2g40250-like n=1 Tax=Tarenaya hassleriana TaxID=28532 RepID=UPI0008FCEF4C|nr:PREDICTED: GDSL esterase/lipase At2g40250-like [Tarenaya hassleriana]
MMNPSRKITTVLTFFTLLLFSYQSHASPSPPVTALFVFGDSTVDPGNNNYIPTIFRGNHSPYGIDFPGKLSTGRFSNGKLTTDFLASFLGLKPTLPAYLDPTVQPGDLLTGVSFASAGTGLDDRTARLSSALTMDKELTYFDEAVGKMKKAVGDGETNRVISNALFVISVGTNDMTINLYDQPFGGFKSVSNYQDSLLNKLEGVIKVLYVKLNAPYIFDLFYLFIYYTYLLT